ncbi:MAG: hypothetical protein AVDCRST_MAG69-1344 [uncultured Solirubrobacteraceae bacterium]|uniref:Uncharacterized protein n=1 Tax=uncultured Solirubrobacteraceae bacterium TaxID=1162706 RepID=A0A6J4S712_9ACTN|nr:MAG: hypothetical protein AVDCRST_MAG69-1344 [uncultured Solirubrobacteraceae bacterium]
MGRRSRRRGEPDALAAPATNYTDDEGNVLALRGSMSLGTRRQYGDALSGSPLSREDAWQRGIEFLFERLAVSWTIAGTEPIEGPKALLARYRLASQDERRFVRDSLRAHLAEFFPELERP